jgi:hypothetical protein
MQITALLRVLAFKETSLLHKSSFALTLLDFASPVSTPILTAQTNGVDAVIDCYGTDPSGAIVPSANISRRQHRNRYGSMARIFRAPRCWGVAWARNATASMLASIFGVFAKSRQSRWLFIRPVQILSSLTIKGGFMLSRFCLSVLLALGGGHCP